jgi:fido (protein-threonine AMPylation protein)
MKPRNIKAKLKEEKFASEAAECENMPYEKPFHKSRRGGRQAASLAKEVRRSRQARDVVSPQDSGLGRTVDGVRERTGEYGSPEDSPEESEEGTERLGSTRYFETAQGTLSYTQVSERLAVALTDILQGILQAAPEDIAVTAEWLTLRHMELAGDLFPGWAGHFRDRDVQVGTYTHPPFYEVPMLVRLFCDDVAERVRHVRYGETGILTIAELFAWADWRFQWIHPFRDFNGRIGRVLLVALFHKIGIPPVDTVQTEKDARRQYLVALQAADNGDLRLLTELWMRRIVGVL